MMLDTAVPADAIEMARQIRSGEISARALVERAVGRVQAAQARLNFLVTPDYERALERVPREEGAVSLPTLIKDLDDQAGLPTRRGSLALAGAAAARASSRFADALCQMGGNSIGKSATPEFGLSPVTEPLSSGPVLNPWNPTLSTGGSSGGAAAAVAAGVVPFAHASDGGGSIRIPASLCGVFGFKPSRGRSLGSAREDGVTDLVSEHVISRSIRDSALVLAALERPGGSGGPSVMPMQALDRPLRIGLITGALSGSQPDPETLSALGASRLLVEGMGHSVVDVEWPIETGPFIEDFTNLWAMGAAASVDALREGPGDGALARLDPLTQGLAARGQGVSRLASVALVGRLSTAKRSYDRLFRDIDVLMTPVLSRASLPLGLLASA